MSPPDPVGPSTRYPFCNSSESWLVGKQFHRFYYSAGLLPLQQISRTNGRADGKMKNPEKFNTCNALQTPRAVSFPW